MLSEKKIRGQVRRLKYEAARRNTGFGSILTHGPKCIGNPLSFVELSNIASALECVLEYSVPIKDIDWRGKAIKIWSRNRPKKG